MADTIKTVTNKDQFPQLFKMFFEGKEVFLRTKSGNLVVHYLGYSDENVAFRIPRVKNLPNNVIMFARHKSNTIYVTLKPIEGNEDTFTLLPEKIQIISEARKEDRKLLDTGGQGTDVIFIYNVVSDFDIKTELSMSQKKADHIKETIIFDLEKQFDNIEIRFINEAKNDLRMKYMIEKKRPIYIPNLNTDPEEKKKEEHNFYLNEIYAKDFKLSSVNKFTSEASVPVFYRAIIPYGYIQVNNIQPMTDGLFAVVKRFGIVINELFKKNKMFVPPEDKFLVSDLSKKGLGIAFKNRRQARFFKQDSLVTFDMMLPTKKKVIVGAITRNVAFHDNGIIKVGMEIIELDAISETNYDEFLESIGQKID